MDNAKKRIRMLRAAYWTGAVFDALTLIPMLVPGIGARVFGLTDFVPGREYRYAMGLAAALMLGWTILLLWADRKPLERRGVLPLTIVVVIGLAAAGAYAAAQGLVPLSRMLPTWIWQAAICGFFLVAYLQAGRARSSPSSLPVSRERR